MILSNISTPLVGAVDTAVVGHLPAAHHIGAVALGALIFTFLYWGFGFLRMATTGIVARAFGAGDARALANTLVRTLLLALVFGAAVIAFGGPLIALALWLLDGSAAVERLAGEYARIRVWSAPGALGVYAFTGVLIGLHNTRAALVLVLTLNLVNMALDFLFVPVLGFGVAGVAWATLIAEYTALATGAWILRADLRRAHATFCRAEVFDRAALAQLMRANLDIFWRTLCLMFSFAWFTAQSAKLGEVALAANAILLHLQSAMAHALDGFAHAAEALAGSAFGARRAAALRRAVRLTTGWAAACAGAVSVAYLAFGEALLGLFTDLDAVAQTAAVYLPWMVALPLLSVWSFQLDGIFIGAGHTRAMRNAMLVSTVAYLALVTALLPLLGNHGLFLGLACFMLIRAATLWRYYPGICAALESADGDGRS